MISNFKVKTIKPTIPKGYEKYYTGVTYENRVISMDITGVNYPIISAIRRILMDECPCKTLDFEYQNYTSKDTPHLLWDLVHSRLRSVPLNQDCPDNTTFSLDVTNNTGNNMNVLMSDLKCSSGNKKWFNDNIIWFTIPPTGSVKIKNITVKKSIGRTHGSAALGFAGRFIATDVDEDVVSSTVADPHDFHLIFENAGTIDPLAHVKLALDILSRKIDTAIIPSEFSSHGNLHVLKYFQETETLGNIIVYYLVNQEGGYSIVQKPDERSDLLHFEMMDEGNVISNIEKFVVVPAKRLVDRLKESLKGINVTQKVGTLPKPPLAKKK